MTIQSEDALEDDLVKQLTTLRYDYVKIDNESDLLANLKTQIEKHNQLVLTDSEFHEIILSKIFV